VSIGDQEGGGSRSVSKRISTGINTCDSSCRFIWFTPDRTVCISHRKKLTGIVRLSGSSQNEVGGPGW